MYQIFWPPYHTIQLSNERIVFFYWNLCTRITGLFSPGQILGSQRTGCLQYCFHIKSQNSPNARNDRIFTRLQLQPHLLSPEKVTFKHCIGSKHSIIVRLSFLIGLINFLWDVHGKKEHNQTLTGLASLGASAEEAAGSEEASVSIGSAAAGAKIVQFTVDGGRTKKKVQKTRWKFWIAFAMMGGRGSSRAILMFFSIFRCASISWFQVVSQWVTFFFYS